MIFSYKSEKQNSIILFHLMGELIDRNQAIHMMAEVETAINDQNNKVVLNLENLKYLNSSGLNILINILTKTRKAGGDVAICCVNKKISELLLITKLNHVFNVCDNQDAAIKILTN